MGLAKASSSFAHIAGIDLPTVGFGSRMGSAEAFSRTMPFEKKKSDKKQKAGAAGGHAKAAAAKKQRTDPNAVIADRLEWIDSRSADR